MTSVDLDALSPQELFGMLQKAAADCFPRDLDQFVAACPLSPANLIGSYFRAPDPADPEAEVLWHEDDRSCSVIEGIVIRQLWSGPDLPFVIYQVELFGLRSEEGGQGAQGVQRVVTLEMMLAQQWRFYDDRGWFDSWYPDGKPPASAGDAVRQEHAKDG